MNRSKLFACAVLLLGPALTALTLGGQRSPAPQATIDVHFSPRGGCTTAVLDALSAAKTTVHVQAYTLTSTPIAQALVTAHRRGVKVEVILDKSQASARYSAATFLHNAGVPVRIDRVHAIAHNKIIVIDGSRVLTGSFNFTRAAEESNAENLLTLDSPALATRYEANFDAHQKHAEAYVPGR